MAKTDTRNPNRRVMFPEAGEGVYLLLRNSGCRDLQNQIGVDWFMACEKACHNYHTDTLEIMLKVMTWKEEKPLHFTLDDLDDGITMQMLSERLMDAYSLAMHGRTFAEQMKWIAEMEKELSAAIRGEDPLLTGPAASSSESSEAPTGPDSNQQSSTP